MHLSCLGLQEVNIFNFDFLIIPMSGNNHWSLLVVCHLGSEGQGAGRGPFVLHLDSMPQGKLLLLVACWDACELSVGHIGMGAVDNAIMVGENTSCTIKEVNAYLQGTQALKVNKLHASWLISQAPLSWTISHENFSLHLYIHHPYLKLQHLFGLMMIEYFVLSLTKRPA